MSELFIHDDAENDLLEMRKCQLSRQAASDIYALLEEIGNDEDILDRLTQDHFGERGHDKFHIRQWIEQQRQGNNMWRLKYFGRLKYRVIYAFIPEDHNYHIIGVVPREFNYERTHPLTKRMVRAYKALRDDV